MTEFADIGPLDPDADAPFGPPALGGALFGGAGSTYAVLDAAPLSILPELCEAQGLRHACLAQNGAGDDLAAVSPWLVELTPDAPLLRALFTEGEAHMTRFWGLDAGIFLRASAEFGAVERHLRRIVKVRDTGGRPVWFRFWDPAVLADYLPKITDWPERIDSLFAAPGLSDPALITVEAGKGRARVFVPEGARPASGHLTLTERDMAILALPQAEHLKAELADWLLRLDPGRFRPFGVGRRMAVAEHVMQQGTRYAFTFKEEFAHLLYRMTYLGGWFHRPPDFAALTDVLSPARPQRMPEMAARFPADYARLMPSAGERAATLAHLRRGGMALRGRFDAVGAEEVRALTRLAETLLPKGSGPGAARAETQAALPDGTLHPRALFYLLRLTCGPHPQGDPLQPWIREKRIAMPEPGVNAEPAAAYAFRRLGKAI